MSGLKCGAGVRCEKWEYCFVKNNITADQKLVVVKIIETICLLPERVARKDTFTSSGRIY